MKFLHSSILERGNKVRAAALGCAHGRKLDFRPFAKPLFMSSAAWVVSCNGCNCVITYFAIDPQLEHITSEDEIGPPVPSAVVAFPCCGAAYRYTGSAIVRGVARRGPMCRRRQQRSPTDGALLVAATIVAAIRLRGEPVKSSPKLAAVVQDSILLARTVLAQI